MVDDHYNDVITTDFPLTPSQWNQLHAVRNGVFVSQLIAQRFHLKAGDIFPVLTAAATRQDGSKAWAFIVLGVTNDIPQDFNGYTVGNYDYLDESRPLAQRGTVGQITFLVSDPARAEATAKAVDALFANSPVPTNTVTLKDAVESAAQAGINIPFVTTVVAAAGLFMILFLTGNGIAQSVRERIPEFAVLKTLGFSDAGVMALVFVEAAIPCLVGAAIGIAVAKALAQQVPHLFPPNVLALPAPYMSPPVLSLAFVFAVLVAFISAVLPALRIKRLDVATALSGR
jgi:putative ABC transport system permease protein